MNTAYRLNNYYDFDADILHSVDEAASRQNELSFKELAQQYGIENGPEKILPDSAAKPVEVVTIKPKSDYDETHARVYHASFAYPANENTAMHAMRLFEADPREQVVVIGNPAMPFASASKMSFRESFDVVHTGSFRPAVDGLLKYLEQNRITHTEHVGYSYGADKAVTAAQFSELYNQSAEKAVLIEPASIVKRSIKRLAQAFSASGAEQHRYIVQSASKPYDEIWDQDNLLKTVGWMAGMLRVSNIAIAKAMAEGSFGRRTDEAMRANPSLRATIAWGSSSELAPDADMMRTTNQLRAAHKMRVSTMRLEGMHHAAVDDIDLNAAIVLQGLRAATR